MHTVAAQRRPVLGRMLTQRVHFLSSLGEAEEQGAEQGTDQQPLARRNADGDGAGHRPEYEADRDRQHVEHDHVLEEP